MSRIYQPELVNLKDLVAVGRELQQNSLPGGPNCFPFVMSLATFIDEDICAQITQALTEYANSGLMPQRQFAWLQHADGVLCLPCGECPSSKASRLARVSTADEGVTWCLQLLADGESRHTETFADQSEPHVIFQAEQIVAATWPDALSNIRLDTSWRAKSPTIRQIKRLQRRCKLRWLEITTLSRGEAWSLLAEARYDRRAAKRSGANE